MSGRVRELRLAAPALAVWLVAATLVGATDSSPWWALAAAAAAAVLLGVAALAGGRRGRVRSLAASLALSAVLAGLVAWCVALRAPEHSPAELRESHTVTAFLRIDGQAVEQQRSYGGSRVKVRATVTRFEAAGRTVSSAAPVVLFAPLPEASGSLDVGALVTVRARVRAMPDGDPVAFQLYAGAAPAQLSDSPPALAWANRLRAGFSEAARRLPSPGGGLLPGLAIGDVRAVSPQLDAAMKTSSLSHLTAVSGSNCAVIVAGMAALAALAGVGRRGRVVVAIVALAAFVVLVTPGPSVMRAAVMSIVVILALASGRPGTGMPALCLAVVGLLVADPWLARDVGFTLSVLATAGLLTLSAPFTRALSRWLPRSFAAVVAIPLAAQLACQPVLVLLQPTLPTFGVLANLLAEPVAPAATLLGLLACLSLPLVPGLGFALAQLAWLPASWIASVATVTAALPASSLPWLAGIPGVAAAVLLGVAVVAALIPVSGEARWRQLVRSAAVAGLLVVGGGLGGGVAASQLARVWVMPHAWQFGACDIGQGDGLVLRGGDGRFGVIDTGPDPALFAHCLSSLGIEHVELLVLTHFDADHAGGAGALVGKVDTVLIGPVDRPAATRLVARLRDGGAQVIEAEAGMAGRLGELDWRVLWPLPEGRTPPGNESSVTIETSGAGMHAIFLGDLGGEAQRLLLATGEVEPVDVVKVAHHGSADQSPALYRALHSRLALISVGAHNDYGHPAPPTVSMLEGLGMEVDRTDREGMLLVSASPSGPVLWSQR